ncbi:MAG TPA: hypothetical protein PKY77_09265 [Phycisphaerae bacterium]|nr:hypothetical protein [Phycisphaerae bacterium]HRY68649.1 hypothetical protein [Phycisphaerae bacterium]HSA25475.1 hypothetical protein [Phycisphaerae bacterium]
MLATRARITLLAGCVLAASSTVTAEPPVTADEGARACRWPEHLPPTMAAWFWHDREFQPGGYKPYLDMTARHSHINLLTTTLRVAGHEVTEPAVHDQIKAAAEYARGLGIRIAMDLDVRLAREAFRKEYPDEMEGMLRLREIPLGGSGEVDSSITSEEPADHYTYGTTPYVALAGRLVRVYSYVRGPQGIEPETVQDVTQRCRVRTETAKEVAVSLPCDSEAKGRTACVVVCFTHLTPAVFAPHLDTFQRKILERYRDAGLAGACKDEWGFPPCYDGCPAHNDFWYSRFEAEAYGSRTGGRELVGDCLLMAFGARGREAERIAAINQFTQMCRERHAGVEMLFHRSVKTVFGPQALVATHPTWWPYPDRREFKKNGLDWWSATRDIAQTDEATPFCVRTALAKRWGSPIWYNMYYSPKVDDYRAELWSAALAGGRINYHPLWPVDAGQGFDGGCKALLRGELMRGECRVRLLSFITTAPLDCPVAVVFGHPGAMNWAGSGYDDVGIGLTDALWQAGYPADLIPTSEIESGSLRAGRDGQVQYGCQKYRAVVLYRPDLDKPVTAEFFHKVIGDETLAQGAISRDYAAFVGKAAGGQTSLYRIGDWKRGFDGKPFDGATALPKGMIVAADVPSVTAMIVARMKELGVEPQAGADRVAGFADCRSMASPVAGRIRLIDGTHVVVSGVKSAGGDPIQTTFTIKGRSVTVDAVGLAAVRFGPDWQLEALAAGGLKHIKAGEFKLDLPSRADLAVWRDSQGRMHGVLQGWDGDVPAALATVTDDWLRVGVPKEME